MQQGDILATFIFSNVFAPVLKKIISRAILLCLTFQLFAILDEITFTAPVQLLHDIFRICSEELSSINIRTVPKKSHILINQIDAHRLPNDIDSQVQVHTDGISLLGTAIGSD